MDREFLDQHGFETAMQALKEKLDDRYAKESDIPTKTSDLDNDSGFITEVTSSDVVDALGYTPADTNDVPTKTSDLTNDSDFVSDASYVHTDNNYSTAEKTSVGQISGIKQDLTQLDSDLTALTTVVGTKANQSDLTSLTNRVGNLETNAISLNRRLTNLEYASKGVLYSEETNTTAAYSKVLDTDVMPWGQLTTIGGKSVAWNQLADQFDTLNTVPIRNNTVITAGHKYLFGGNVPSGNLYFYIGKDSGEIYYTNHHNIFTSNVTITADGTSNTNANSIWFYNKSTDIFLIDLTAMYGAGNEPATTSDPRIAEIEAYATLHPEYNSSEIVSAKVDKVISTSASDVLIANYPIPSEVQALDGYGWSAGNVYNYIDFAEKKFHKRVGKFNFDDIGTWTQYPAETNSFWYANDSSDIVKASNRLVITTAYNVTNYVNKVSSGSMQIKVYTQETTAPTGDCYYVLDEEVVTDISAYLTDSTINVEGSGKLTFHQNGTEFVIPNSETFLIKTGG